MRVRCLISPIRRSRGSGSVTLSPQPPAVRISAMMLRLKITSRAMRARSATPVGTARPSISGAMMFASLTRMVLADWYLRGIRMPAARNSTAISPKAASSSAPWRLSSATIMGRRANSSAPDDSAGPGRACGFTGRAPVR